MDKAERLYVEANMSDEELVKQRRRRRLIVICIFVAFVLVVLAIVALSLFVFLEDFGVEGTVENEVSFSPEFVTEKDIWDYFSLPDLWSRIFRRGY